MRGIFFHFVIRLHTHSCSMIPQEILRKTLFCSRCHEICVVRPYYAYCAISKILATLYYPLHAKHLESVYTLFIVRITMTDSFESTGLQSLTLKRVIIRKSIKPFHFLCIANLIIDSHHPIRETLIKNDQSIACSG